MKNLNEFKSEIKKISSPDIILKSISEIFEKQKKLRISESLKQKLSNLEAFCRMKKFIFSFESKNEEQVLADITKFFFLLKSRSGNDPSAVFLLVNDKFKLSKIFYTKCPLMTEDFREIITGID